MDRGTIELVCKSLAAPLPQGKLDLKDDQEETAAAIFRELLLDTQRSLPSGKEDAIPAVDALLESFRRGTTPILPRLDLMNEALLHYTSYGEMIKAQSLYNSMKKECMKR